MAHSITPKDRYRPSNLRTISAASSIMGAEGIMTPHSEQSEREQLLETDIERLGGISRDSQYGSTSARAIDAGQKPPQGRKKLRKRVKYYIPSLSWIPNYSASLLGGDLLAGLTVASMLIPQSVSYASSLAKLSPVTGLFSASIPGIVYAFLGTSRHLNVAPEAALSLLLGQAVDDIRHDLDDPHSDKGDALGLAVATIITLQVGLLSFIFGFFRLGFLDVILSRALLRGFIAAMAVIILIEQLIPMLGLVPLERLLHPATTIEKLLFLVENMFTHGNSTTAIISFVALGTLVLLRFIKGCFKKYWFIYRIPEVLVVVVVSTILSREFRWDEKGVDILGSVKVVTSGSFFQFPIRSSNMKYLRRTTSTAVVSAVVGYLDSMVAAKQAGSRFGYGISPNRELVALGAANIGGSLIPGTLPAFGSITRTRINGDVGGSTQMASLVCSAVILLATFYLLPLLYYLPKCVLASIITLVVFSLIQETPHDLIYYWRMSAWMDLLLVILTFVLSIVWNVEVGIVVSLVISLLLVVRRSSKTRMTILGRIPGTDRWKPINENPEAEEDVSGALIVRIRENLDFANTAQLKERLRRLELYGVDKSHPSEDPRRTQATVLVFHMADMDDCDAIACQIFYELIEEYRNRGVGIFITHLRAEPLKAFEKAGIVKLLGADAFEDNVADAMAKIRPNRW
ncbi:sulfate anion transporter [Lentinula aff. lateritia]|uniref:Sulfate anion transporter n=1 Tax=Lentinula aff. lateritia TaxID=2804960 RepID=A0ACC1U1U3_9AGAR|nr:sulfate anion transporter [Lentinula aff. lateritia]